MAEESVESLKAKISQLEERVERLEKAIQNMPETVAKRQRNLTV